MSITKNNFRVSQLNVKKILWVFFPCVILWITFTLPKGFTLLDRLNVDWIHHRLAKTQKFYHSRQTSPWLTVNSLLLQQSRVTICLKGASWISRGDCTLKIVENSMTLRKCLWKKLMSFKIIIINISTISLETMAYSLVAEDCWPLVSGQCLFRKVFGDRDLSKFASSFKVYSTFLIAL